MIYLTFLREFSCIIMFLKKSAEIFFKIVRYHGVSITALFHRNGENHKRLKTFIKVIKIRLWNVVYPLLIMYTMSVGRGLGSLSVEPCLLKISCILIIYVRVRDASITQHCGVIPVHDGTSHSIFQHPHTLTRMPFLHFPIIYKAETNT